LTIFSYLGIFLLDTDSNSKLTLHYMTDVMTFTSQSLTFLFYVVIYLLSPVYGVYIFPSWINTQEHILRVRTFQSGLWLQIITGLYAEWCNYISILFLNDNCVLYSIQRRRTNLFLIPLYIVYTINSVQIEWFLSYPLLDCCFHTGFDFG
jgi:hypothetical protein